MQTTHSFLQRLKSQKTPNEHSSRHLRTTSRRPRAATARTAHLFIEERLAPVSVPRGDARVRELRGEAGRGACEAR